MFFVLKSIFAQTVCTTSTSQPAFAFKRFKRQNVMMQSESPHKSASSNKIQVYVENSSNDNKRCQSDGSMACRKIPLKVSHLWVSNC